MCGCGCACACACACVCGCLISFLSGDTFSTSAVFPLSLIIITITIIILFRNDFVGEEDEGDEDEGNRHITLRVYLSKRDIILSFPMSTQIIFVFDFLRSDSVMMIVAIIVTTLVDCFSSHLIQLIRFQEFSLITCTNRQILLPTCVALQHFQLPQNRSGTAPDLLWNGIFSSFLFVLFLTDLRRFFSFSSFFFAYWFFWKWTYSKELLSVGPFRFIIHLCGFYIVLFCF